MKLPQDSQQLSTIIQGAGQSVVQVHGRARLPATAVVWRNEKGRALLVTANHVIEPGRSFQVTLPDGERTSASLIGRDPKIGLALLQIPREAAPARWTEESELPPVGEMVVAVGRPFGALEASLGIIRASATREASEDSTAPNEETAPEEERDLEERTGTDPWSAEPWSAEPWSDEDAVDDPWQDTIEKLSRSAERAAHYAEEMARRAVRSFEMRLEDEGEGWQPRRRHRRRRRRPPPSFARRFRQRRAVPAGFLPTDLTLYPGFSGGPLLGLDGQVLGINTSAFGNSYALSLPLLREAVAALEAEPARPNRAFLGVSGQSVRLPAALANELAQEVGLLLTSIQAGSAAEAAGLLLGDILLSLADERVTSLRELHAALTAERIGQALPLRLVRAGSLLKITVQLTERS